MPVTASCRVRKTQLGVWWQHRSTCGTVDYNQQLPGYETSRTMRQLEERVVADYRHTFEKLDLGIRGGYRYDSFNYYGLRFPGVQGIASPGQEINRFFLKSQIASNNPEAQLHYRASLAYHRYGYRRGYLQGDKGAAENWVEADFALTAPIDKSSDITVDGAFDYIGYSQLPSASGYGMAVVESPVQLAQRPGIALGRGQSRHLVQRRYHLPVCPRRAIRLDHRSQPAILHLAHRG